MPINTVSTKERSKQNWAIFSLSEQLKFTYLRVGFKNKEMI